VRRHNDVVPVITDVPGKIDVDVPATTDPIILALKRKLVEDQDFANNLGLIVNLCWAISRD
jgi:hypothetical protein